MPISALPQSTIRSLGSSVIITTPCDVVKELIDNAIDAGASFIEVAVSSNYLDTIRVRDDGHGIDVDDFDALGRRAHTSKLKAFNEIGSRARESLGFRGEALAAMNTFATISITTRTTSDVVATRLQLKRAVGGSENRCPTSAPVGTTVQVTKLFDTLPARKQYSLRNSAKYIKSTKDLFKAYVLARPDLRLSFKILGEAVGGWSYAPACAAEINEATLQIFGKALANSCIHVSRNSACDQAAFTQASQEATEDFILEAFMPKTGFDLPAVKGKGLYLSVDSRPLSSTCDIAKKITAIFKNHLNRVTGSNESCTSVSNPFLRLNIRCPAHSYDANVTPLKDEVVFGDENKITASFEGLCQRIYSERFMAEPFLSSKSSRSEEEAGDSKSHIENSGNMHTKDLNIFSGISQGDHLTDQVTALLPLPREPDSQNGVSLTKMRTSKIVNMSRINSNSTDEDCTINSVDIQVPVSLMAASQISPGRRPQVPRISASENIERYLLSRKNEGFKIATDETATRKSDLQTGPPESPPGIFNRKPLQPLTESMLNAMNGQPDSESDVSSAEPEMLTLDDNTERTINANAREERAQQISPVPTPSSPDHEPLALRSPRQLRSVAEWLTPPSSGPLRNVRLSNSSFRPQQRTTARDSPTGNVAVRPWPRAPQSGRTIPFILPGENRNRRRLTHNETIEQEVDIPRDNPRETRAQLYFQGVQGLNRQQDRTTNAFELASQLDTTRRPVSHKNFFSHEPGHHSHIIQTSLLDSQYSGDIPSSRRAQEVLNARDNLSATPQRDIRPSIEASVCGDSQNRAPFRNTHGKLEDPRLYLIKRRRSQARHGIARRLSSRRLPLEVTPIHLAMQSSSTSRRLSLRRVKTLARQTRLQGYDIVPGDWGNAITFKSMEEAGKVESRLQDAVDSWKQTQNQAIEVEYKLRSAAKGKNPAFTDQ
ncbi:hypothetical protein M441DRAFT_72973 [Trichoderma asperellum CBS 433.97]|uniref:DNA mismatch repair protein S5 domain-containing protein n=1 Tax=Trichoderma asperellum (strain ATCC 204424 / CBS 433.97 / NBRC 101777) TaxID=1042311 RepID=A0A2T3YWH3_TRIA4|nr:hypothetical protein M441DRAFT_72973 [Trichoderma asperellum CBS 433.97]PTB36909.1 hypothetical protein M441DRAFT_72973 [Trichoderma asperellum CBS 433.97]